jgi:hypothetical protein
LRQVDCVDLAANFPYCHDVDGEFLAAEADG